MMRKTVPSSDTTRGDIPHRLLIPCALVVKPEDGDVVHRGRELGQAVDVDLEAGDGAGGD